MVADAWATALTILPRAEALALAEAQQLPLCYVEGDREYTSSKWREMLD
jgi:thiamine biosynthesis lipoprotein ApbE